MPFPGNRTRKLSRPIKASVITGELNFDSLLFFTADCFGADDITLDGANAMQQGGADLALSADEAGTMRLPLHVVRCELNATPASSEILLCARRPATSDTVNTPLYIWWGDATESLPADTENCGRNDVYNALTDATGDSIPFVTWGMWHLEEPVGNPAPQFKDSSGNGRHLTTTGATSSAIKPGRGLTVTSAAVASIYRSGDTFSPGTGDFCVMQTFKPSAAYQSGFALSATDANNVRVGCTTTTVYIIHVAGTTREISVPVASGSYLCAASRAGGTVNIEIGAGNNSVTGVSAVSFGPLVNGGTSQIALASNYSTPGTGMGMYLNSAPNIYWLRALHDCIESPTTFFDCTTSSIAAAVSASIVFDGLNAGTEVRIYEYPHPTAWELDFTDATPTSIGNQYALCEVQGSSAKTLHYFYSGTDPAVAGATGHAVTITGYTDAQIATAYASAMAAVTDLAAAAAGAIVSASNERNGETTEPTYSGAAAEVTLVQIGGTSTDAVDGIESSTGTSWTATYQILRPRRVVISMLSLAYKNVRYTTVLSTAGLLVPAGALQIEDLNYANPA